MTIQELKTKILETGCFEDNKYLDEYCSLIFNNLETKREKYKTSKHHIIPRCYYKINNLDVDNSKENIVNLTHANHLVAHFYLYKAAKTKLIKKGMAGALILMCNVDLEDINWNYIKEFKNEYQSMVELYYIECNSQLGAKRTLATRQLMSQSALKSKNKRRLGCKDSKETCEKKSKSMKNKKCHLGCKDSIESREKKSKAFKGTFYVTNGKENHRIRKEQEEFYLSQGFHRGRTFTIQEDPKYFLCVETQEIFTSFKEAISKHPNYIKNTLYSALSGRMKTAYGYHWRYLTEEEVKLLNISNK